jgi:pimeloyl-ACP methyl ester carboxylesterase
MSVEERILSLPGIDLAAKVWGSADGEPVLALHGWLDNAASFDRLAPLLPELHLVALDLPGHGRSQHRPPGGSHHFVDWVADVIAAADGLGWERFSLLGHSMGAGIASLMPATFPERIVRVALIEGLGPLASPAAEVPQRLAAAISDERRLADLGVRSFPDFPAAVSVRMLGSDLDRSSAEILVERAVQEVADGVRFLHDPRLKAPSRLRLTEEQVRAFLAGISCPALAVKGRKGLPFPADLLAARLGTIKDVQLAELPGGHHLHLTHPHEVAPLLRSFFLAPQQTRSEGVSSP